MNGLLNWLQLLEGLVDLLDLLGQRLQLVQWVNERETLRPPEDLRDVYVVDAVVQRVHLRQEHVLLPDQQADEYRGVLALNCLQLLLLLHKLAKITIRVAVRPQED